MKFVPVRRAWVRDYDDIGGPNLPAMAQAKDAATRSFERIIFSPSADDRHVSYEVWLEEDGSLSVRSSGNSIHILPEASNSIRIVTGKHHGDYEVTRAKEKPRRQDKGNAPSPEKERRR